MQSDAASNLHAKLQRRTGVMTASGLGRHQTATMRMVSISPASCRNRGRIDTAIDARGNEPFSLPFSAEINTLLAPTAFDVGN
jgi:hypothetical protein